MPKTDKELAIELASAYIQVIETDLQLRDNPLSDVESIVKECLNIVKRLED